MTTETLPVQPVTENVNAQFSQRMQEDALAARAAIDSQTKIGAMAVEKGDYVTPPTPTTTPEVKVEEKPVEVKVKVEPKREPEKENHDVRRMKKYIERAYKAEAELNALKAQQQPQQQVPATKPVRDQYATDADFIEALTDYKLAERLPQVTAQHQRMTQQQQIEQSFLQKEVTAKAKYQDYDEAIADAADVPINPALVEPILASDIGPDLRYHLATHLDELDRLNRLPAYAAIKELGKLEMRLSSPATVQVSKAPAPIIPPVPGLGAVNTNPDALGTRDWIAQRNLAERKRLGLVKT